MTSKKNKGGKKAKAARKPVVLANNAAPQNKSKKSRKPKRQGGGSQVKVAHVRGVCSVTDPFCPAAKNSKWPDGTAGNTLTSQFRGNVTVSSGVNGTGLINFAAAAPFGYLPTASVTGTAGVLAATFTAYQTGSMLATYGAEYRIVSMGVIARCIASATSASGYATFGTSGPVATGTTVTFGSELYDEVHMKAIQPGMEFAWISQPRGTTAREFRSLSTNSTATSNDWSTLMVEISGATASTAMMNFEWYVNVEWIANINTAITTLAKPNPPKSSAAESATSSVHSTLGSFVEGGVKQVEDAIAAHASNALSSLMENPFDTLMALFPF
jgi:hypothetical protein